MKTNKLLKSLLIVVTAVLPLTVRATDIPLSVGNYLTTSESVTTGTINNNDKGNLGGIKKEATATFTLANASAQDMVLTFLTGTQNAGSNPQVTVTLNNGTSDVFAQTIDVEGTSNWTPATKHIFELGNVPAGTYSLKFAFSNTSGYVCNLGSIGIYNKTDFDATLDVIPGDITLTNGVYNGPKTENDGANVGYVQNGGKAAYTFYSSKEGAYDMTLDIYRYNQGGTMNVKIVDLATGIADYNQDYAIANDAPASYTQNTINIPGMTQGYKTMTFTFSNGSSYICNYKNIAFAFKGIAAEFSAYTIAGQTVTDGTETDYLCNLPVSYDATTTFAVSATNGTIAVTAKASDDSNVAVTNNGDGTYTVSTPSLNDYVIVTATLTPNSGAVAAKTTSTLKLFRIGEMSLTSVTVDGVVLDVLTDINNAPYSATYDACYTTAPVVAATQIDGAAATIDAPAISGSTYTYTVHGSMAGGTIARDYTLILNNVHVYTPTGSETSVNIKNNEGTRENNTWTNGIYTLATTSLDGYNQYFKMNGNDYTISVPSDVVVKQLIFKECSNNYANNDARLLTVTSTGATAYIPVDNKYYHESEGSKHDIIVNIEGHTAGTDICFNQPKLGQPMAWIQLTTVKSNPGTAPVKTAESVTVVNNHAVVAVTFDREIANDVEATINNTTVTAEGGSAVLTFPVWGLSYSSNYTLTIAAGAVVDAYNNTNTAAINVAVNTEAKPTVAKAAYDYVVGTADELKAAITAIDATNTSASAARKVIFLKNGIYNLGGDGSATTVQWVNAHNISFVGESKEGVIICGNSADISNPVLNIRYGSGQYMQDLTVRNLRDFDQSNRKGVSVAVYGGNKAIFKNVAMQAQQDTQVTGERGYYINCDFYGAVDFLCGGGDHFYDQCNFYVTNAGYITAPSTSAANKWGYVMQHCTIDKYVGSYTYEADGNFTLGRPWQGEPRNYWLNTTMKVQPSAGGWGGMGNLPTHFYEYNSMDANGNAIDLSGRTNSSTSTNHYTPVLTDEQAAKFTVENVLGSTDSWLPTDYTTEVVAPTISLSGSTLSWTAVADARCYVIFKNGEYLTNLTGTSYELTAEGLYTVRAANEMGGLGAVATSVVFKRNITADKWSTIVLPFDIASTDINTVFGADAKVAELTGGTTTDLTFSTTLTDSKMKANQPYAIKVASDFTNTAIENVDIVEGMPTQTVGDWQFIGTYTSGNIPEGSYFFSNNKLYKAGDDTNTIAPFRAYFTYTGAGEARDLNFIIDEEDVTAINSAKSQVLTANGQYYDLQGRKVANPTRGLYIVNGKKVVIK